MEKDPKNAEEKIKLKIKSVNWDLLDIHVKLKIYINVNIKTRT